MEQGKEKGKNLLLRRQKKTKACGVPKLSHTPRRKVTLHLSHDVGRTCSVGTELTARIY